MKIGGKLTYDRQEWISGAAVFGTERFGDACNNLQAQAQRLDYLRCSFDSVVTNRRLDGLKMPVLEFWDTLQARAKIRAESGGAGDGIPGDVYLELPFIAVARIHRMFSDRFEFKKSSVCSPFWNTLQFVGLPKAKMISDFNDFRWICKSPVLQQWFLRALQYELRSQLRPSCVHSYGFRRHTCTSDITALFREVFHYATLWDVPLIAAQQDVKTAFDSMPHELISKALTFKGVSSHFVGLHLRELSGMQATIKIPMVGETDLFPFCKGGKQGGVETPDEWRALVDFVLEPVVKAWENLHLGFCLVADAEEDKRIVTHAIWADNIVLFATSFCMMQKMINDVDCAFAVFRNLSGKRYFVWKPDSLEYIVAPSMTIGSHDGLKVPSDNGPLAYLRKDAIVLLGDSLDSEGSSANTLSFNLGRAEASFFKHQKLFCDRTQSIKVRLGAWSSTAGSTASYNAETWHLTGPMLNEIRTWERQMLRRLLRLRRRPGEGNMDFNKRSAAIIAMWMQKYGIAMVWERVLKSVFKAAWREANFALDDGAQPLKWVREIRSELWWQTYGFTNPQSKRRKTGILHARAGRQRTSWENPFVAAWGLHWRAQRDKCLTLSEWMHQWNDFRNRLSTVWQLPWIGIEMPDSTDINVAWASHHIPTSIADIPRTCPNPRADRWGERASVDSNRQPTGRASFVWVFVRKFR